MPQAVQIENIVDINSMNSGLIQIFHPSYYHYYTNLAGFVKLKRKIILVVDKRPHIGIILPDEKKFSIIIDYRARLPTGDRTPAYANLRVRNWRNLSDR